LGDAERKPGMASVNNIFKIDKNCLGGFRPKISNRSLIFFNPNISFKHRVKESFWAQILTAFGAFFGFFPDFIGSKTLVATTAFTNRIGKAG